MPPPRSLAPRSTGRIRDEATAPPYGSFLIVGYAQGVVVLVGFLLLSVLGLA